ncbi:MAG: hypothetical protein KAI40_12450 [Desulfobacterales bacterium]|nr:hypothetical protein [Desulfobacterales bacterium]
MASFFSKLFGGSKDPKEEKDNPYLGLRQLVFDLHKPEFAKKYGFVKDQIVGFVMDATTSKGDSYTVVSTFDHSASLYTSTGGGFLGSGQREEGAQASKELLELSNYFYKEFKNVNKFTLPSSRHVKFYIVVSGRVIGSEEFLEDDLGNGRVPLSPLFHKCHELISVIREYDEKDPTNMHKQQLNLTAEDAPSCE